MNEAQVSAAEISRAIERMRDMGEPPVSFVR
jgi:hypothetical protein